MSVGEEGEKAVVGRVRDDLDLHRELLEDVQDDGVLHKKGGGSEAERLSVPELHRASQRWVRSCSTALGARQDIWGFGGMCLSHGHCCKAVLKRHREELAGGTGLLDERRAKVGDGLQSVACSGKGAMGRDKGGRGVCSRGSEIECGWDRLERGRFGGSTSPRGSLRVLRRGRNDSMSAAPPLTSACRAKIYRWGGGGGGEGRY